MRQYRHRIDVGEYSFLDFHALLEVISRKNLESEIEDEIKELYSVFDSHKNGYITAADMKAVLVGLNPRITDEQVDSIILEADRDGDGVLSYE
jgi:Ca2+-binding EF-hand superfamily protein